MDFCTCSYSISVVVVDSEAQRDVQMMLENWDNPVFHTVQRVSVTSSDMTCIPQRFKCCISQCTVEVQCVFLNCEQEVLNAELSSSETKIQNSMAVTFSKEMLNSVRVRKMTALVVYTITICHSQKLKIM